MVTATYTYKGLVGELAPRDVEEVKFNDDVTVIREEAFRVCLSLTRVVIPDTVEKIELRAFCGCENLKSVVIPGSVKEVGDCAFYSCKKLDNLVLCDGIKFIRVSAFLGCDSLTSVIIPKSVVRIDGAFYRCKNLKYLTLSDDNNDGCLEAIGWNAFAHCPSLQSVAIPMSVKTIGDSAFYDCTGLERLILPDNNLKMSIGLDAFADCTSLRSVFIPESVNKIESWAFRSCRALEYVVIITSDTQKIGKHIFHGCSSLKRLFKTSKEALKHDLSIIVKYPGLGFDIIKRLVNINHEGLNHTNTERLYPFMSRCCYGNVSSNHLEQQASEKDLDCLTSVYYLLINNPSVLSHIRQ